MEELRPNSNERGPMSWKKVVLLLAIALLGPWFVWKSLRGIQFGDLLKPELVSLAFFGALLLFIGRFFGSTADPYDFQIGQRKVGKWTITFGIFSVVGAGELIAMMSYAGSHTWWASTLFFSFALGCIAFLPFVSRLHKLTSFASKDRRFDLISIPDLAYLHYGKPASVVVAFLMFLALGALLLIQFAIGSQLLADLTGVSANTHVLGIGILLILYVWLGGFKGVLATDLPQIIILFGVFFITALVPSLVTDSAAVQAQPVQTTRMPLSVVAVLAVGGVCWVLGGGDIWERILATEDTRVARGAIINNIIMLSVMGLILSMAGIALAPYFFDPANPDATFSSILSSLASASGPNRIVSAAFAMALFAAILSTADTELLILSQIFQREAFYDREAAQSQPEPRETRYVILGVTIVAGLLAMALRGIVMEIYLALLNVFIIAGLLALAMFFNRGSTRLAVATSIISVAFIFYLLVSSSPWLGELPSLLVALPLVINFIPSNRRVPDLIRSISMGDGQFGDGRSSS